MSAVTEDTTFSSTVSISSDMFDPPITSIAVVKGINTAGTITITIDTGADTFTISGKYNDNFPKVINYLDVNKSPQTATYFSELPAEYFLVNEYLAGSVTSLIASYSVSVNGSTIGTVTQTILNNYTVGQTALKAAVVQGQV